MKPTALLLLGLAAFAAPAAHADVFSSQTFSGETATLNNLPGVDLNAVPGFSGGTNNCVEADVPAYAGSLATTRGTTCSFGNFSITTTGGNAQRHGRDLTYGDNPPPWMQGWRP